MVDEKFLEKLRDYFNKKYKAEFKIDTKPIFKDEKWHIITNSGYGVGVHELVDGRIEVYSNRVGDFEDVVQILLDTDVYGSRLKKAKSEEERKRIWAKIRKEKEEILNDLANGKWGKYLEEKFLRRPYSGFVLRLYWGEEVARRISEKYKIDVKYELTGHRTFFTSVFNPEGMSEEQVFNEIARRADAVHAAHLTYEFDSKGKERFCKEFVEKVRRNRRLLV
ncbi:MAG: hypothetical protein N3F08_05130 [Crenarchaeota archaeon]|nr:hypothetical protein [Thermoproteota archaeon]